MELAGLPRELLRARDLLAGDVLPHPGRLGSLSEASGEVQRVVGVGVGRSFDDSSYVLRVYLAYPGLERIVPNVVGEFKVETEVTGWIQAGQANRSGPPAPLTRLVPPRPVAAGVSLGNMYGGTGTLGFLVKDNNQLLYVLGTNHTMARCNRGARGDPILQPGPDDGGVNPNDALAVLERWEDIKFGGYDVNEVDAAIGHIGNSNSSSIYPFILKIGQISGSVHVIQQPNGGIGSRVQKTGRSTHHTWGVIHDPDALIDVWYDPVSNFARFDHQIVVSPVPSNGASEPFAVLGDSGALVVDETNRAIGLYIATSTGPAHQAFVNPIETVLQRLAVSICTIGWT